MKCIKKLLVNILVEAASAWGGHLRILSDVCVNEYSVSEEYNIEGLTNKEKH